MEAEKIRHRVDRAIERLEDVDEHLLEYDVHEQAITHKLGEYLQQEFPEWNVDCEYNRQNWELPKRLDSYPKDTVRPDIIVHQRGPQSESGENLLIVEVKSPNYSDDDGPSDEEKIQAFMGEKNYNYGLFIDFRETESDRLTRFNL